MVQWCQLRWVYSLTGVTQCCTYGGGTMVLGENWGATWLASEHMVECFLGVQDSWTDCSGRSMFSGVDAYSP